MRGRRVDGVRAAVLSRTLAVGALALAFATGCASLGRSMAPAAMATLLAGDDAFSTDDDPELVRAAMPAVLKLLDTALLERPNDAALLAAAARAYAVYAWAFPETDALLAAERDAAASAAARGRSKRLYLRARDYGLRGLGVRHPELPRALAGGAGLERALARCGVGDVDTLLWTGAAWAGAIAASHGDPALVADLGTARALVERAAAIAPGHEDGLVLAALLPFDGLPAALGGSAERGRARYADAARLSGGRDASIDVLYADAVARPAGDRAGFEAALRHAIAVDPDAAPRRRLANRVAQQRAQALLERVDHLFLEDPVP